jgi:hypothetical protein
MCTSHDNYLQNCDAWKGVQFSEELHDDSNWVPDTPGHVVTIVKE